MRGLIALLILTFAPAVFSQSVSCPSAAEIATLGTHFKFQEWSAVTKTWTAGFSGCVADGIEAKIYQALLRLERLPLLDELTGTWTSNLVGASPITFVRERIKVIRINKAPDNTHCGNNDKVLAFASSSSDNSIDICPLSASSNSIEIMSTIVHEARHLQSAAEKKLNVGAMVDTHPHAFCKRGRLAHEFACDETFDGQNPGAYVAGLEFLLRIARTKSVDAELRDLAMRATHDYAESHFNTLPGGTKTGLLLLDHKGTVHFFDNNERTLTPFVTGVKPTTIFTLRFVPTFFDPENGSVKSSYAKKALTDTDGQFAQRFREFTPEVRKQLLDVYYGTNYACLLFKTFLQCESSTGDDVVIVGFPDTIEPVQFAAMNEPINGSDLVHLVTTSGPLFMLPMETDIKKWNWDQFTETPTFMNFVSVAIIPEKLQRFAVTIDGQVVTLENKMQAVPELSKMKIKKMQAPYYWTPALEDL